MKALSLLAVLGACAAPQAEPLAPVPERKVVAMPASKPVKQEYLSLIEVPAGQTCPKNDPQSFGVFMKSENSKQTLICYYN
tara:strand:+ start:191 stop:433 length:243 start_codon:yes stop_codon:yes gene_type:complete